MHGKQDGSLRICQVNIIATLKRFFARRIKSSIVFSDSATNFVGNPAELKLLRTLVLKMMIFFSYKFFSSRRH